jgi:GAF domain-containing protein
METFADQAAIAIENARLLSELQARTQELTRSVGQLTALGEVGRAVSSTLDLETVLTTIVSRAVQLADLEAGAIYGYGAFVCLHVGVVGVLIFEGSPPLGGFAPSLAAKLRPPKVPFALGSASNRVPQSASGHGVGGTVLRVRQRTCGPNTDTQARRAGEPLGQED